MSPPSRLIEAAREAATRAAAVCRVVQQDLAAVRTLTKDDRSPVTVADFASQALVTATLLERLGRDFEKAALVAEEDSSFLRRDENASYRAAVLRAMKAAGRDVDEATLLRWIDRGAGEPGAESFWTLDPIDGTKGPNYASITTKSCGC